MSAQNSNGKLRLEDVERYEFLLNYLEVGRPVIRVALGGLVDCTQRKTFTPRTQSDDEFETGNLTGDIGFMDIVLRQENVPQPGVTEYKLGKFWVMDAITILSIGVEPQYQFMHGYGSLLIQRAEQIAREENRNYVVIDNIVNSKLATMVGRRGYLLSRSEHRAVKDLNSDFSWMPQDLRANVLAARAQL